ncbi:hypothetical protein [Spirochaeta isovalerica]|uniref:Uncharacterized protein n=1 Tax=Spirochaeta isovalerica TaxID=150 RepID=A0A841RFB2_9SPIO|nr:hypothetical protein [Spirochaeta isovalerica]MBB6481907.1 hypothetical protein [Spirochaeta isovalerica]
MESPFYRGLKKIKKNHFAGKVNDVEAEIKEMLYRNLNLDDSVCDDIFFRYCSEKENLFDSAEILADIVDLFNRQYDEDTDPLTEEDWIYVRNIVDASAEEMDMDVITYIMRLIVDRGLY